MRSQLPALLAACSLGFSVLGCSQSSPPTPDATANPTADSAAQPRNSHDRMVADLKMIHRANLYERMFHGESPVEADEDQLNYIPGSAIKPRFEVLYRVGKRRLWRGETEQAIAHLREALQLAEQSSSRKPNSLWEKATFQLGLAYLRKGENENCVACTNGESCLLPIRDHGIHTQQTGSRKAIDLFTALLRHNPEHLQAKWLLNVAAMTVGEYPDGVPTEFLVDPARFESDVPFPRFANIASDKNLATVNLSGGSIVDDFDNDGDLDIMTSSWASGDQIQFFRNQDGEFENATDEAGLTGLYGGLNLIHADYDNDGDLDVLVLRGAWMNQAGCIPNSLLQNDGSGHFRDVTYDCGIGQRPCPTQTAAWFDYDNDGDLDLYIGNEHLPCELFNNNGHGQFRNVAAQAGVQNNSFTKGVTCGDVNGDDFPDIYVSNLDDDNRLYINNQDGTFTDVAAERGVTGPKMSFPVWFWDFNQDGALDLYVASYSYDLTYIADKYFGEPLPAERDALYQGDGQGGFVEVGKQQSVHGFTQPMGANFGDLDNDGYPDFYLGTGYPGYEALMPNLMFWNQRGQGFADVTTAGGFGHLQKGHGIAFADIDNDGDQDVFAEMGGAFPGDQAANALYENPGFGNHQITIKLIGQQSNRSAIGARITAEIIEEGTPRSVYKWVNSGGSFGANPLRQTIGLGAAERIEQLKIYWPTTGKTQVFQDVAADQSIEVVEGGKEFTQSRISLRVGSSSNTRSAAARALPRSPISQ
ncbi:CRTAC1 family protein [Roseimaritima ulvae]|uniref:CRTAC1 family protein n=1 Tax=Roseimaritima ulvae TaxID=980254 RepID=UPI000832896A|nr:CRTAC1 family protein [Roseimaritima ulvae]